jgi:hypothetical protein
VYKGWVANLIVISWPVFNIVIVLKKSNTKNITKGASQMALHIS